MIDIKDLLLYGITMQDLSYGKPMNRYDHEGLIEWIATGERQQSAKETAAVRSAQYLVATIMEELGQKKGKGWLHNWRMNRRRRLAEKIAIKITRVCRARIRGRMYTG